MPDYSQLQSTGSTILQLMLPEIHPKLRVMLESAFAAGIGDFSGVNKLKHRFEGLAMLCSALQASSMRSTVEAEHEILLHKGLTLSHHLMQHPDERWAFTLSRAAVLLKHSNALAPELMADALQMNDDQQTIMQALFAITTDDELAILRCIEGFACFGGVDIETQKIRHRLLLVFYSLVRGSPHDLVAVCALKNASVQSGTSGLSAKKQRDLAQLAAAKQQQRQATKEDHNNAGDGSGGAAGKGSGDVGSSSDDTVYMVAPRGVGTGSVALKPDNERLMMRLICISHGGIKFTDGVDELLNRCGLSNKKKRMYVAVAVVCNSSVHSTLGQEMKEKRVPGKWLSVLQTGSHPDVDDEDRVQVGMVIVTGLLEAVSADSKADMRSLLNAITGLTIRKTIEKTRWADIKVRGLLSLVCICITLRELEDKAGSGEYAPMRNAVSKSHQIKCRTHFLCCLQIIKHITALGNAMGLKTSEKTQLSLLIDCFWGDLLRTFDFQHEVLGASGYVPLWQLDWWRLEVKDVTGLSTDTKCIWMTDAGMAVSMHKERVRLLCSLLQCSVGQLKTLAITIMRPVWQVRMAANYKNILLSTYKLVRAEFKTNDATHDVDVINNEYSEEDEDR
jgi:hypothetical protein